MTSAQQSAWEQLLAHLRQGTLIGSVESVLSYDEQTVMPTGAAEYRGEQLAWISVCNMRMRQTHVLVNG